MNPDNMGRSIAPNEGPNRPDAARCLGLRCGAYARIVIDGDPFCEDCAPDVLLAMDCSERMAFAADLDVRFARLPARKLAEPWIDFLFHGERIDLELAQWRCIKAAVRISSSAYRAA